MKFDGQDHMSMCKVTGEIDRRKKHFRLCTHVIKLEDRPKSRHAYIGNCE